jgi:glycosyltransferase domain-containing protein
MQMVKTEQVTIVIPTMDRSAFVIRALRYYAKTRFRGEILIGDSSEPAEYRKVQEEALSLSGKLNIKHHSFPKGAYANDAVVVGDLTRIVKTKYVCQPGDDDFLITNTLGECAMFLDLNPSWIAVRGKRLNFVLDSDLLEEGLITDVELVAEADLSAESATLRYKNYMRNGRSTQFYLYRAETFRRMYEYAHTMVIRHIGVELIPCSIGVIDGKIATLDRILTMYQVHRKHHFSWTDVTMYDLLYADQFPLVLQECRKVISLMLEKADQCPHEKAQEIVDQELFGYINRMLSWQYKARYEKQTRSSTTFRAIIRTLPGVGVPISALGIYWRLRKVASAFPKATLEKRALTLRKLMSAESQYGQDFMPVYKHLTAWKTPAV